MIDFLLLQELVIDFLPHAHLHMMLKPLYFIKSLNGIKGVVPTWIDIPADEGVVQYTVLKHKIPGI